jgi:diguanylate cyclase (GGDEF)-like protein
MQVKGVDKSGFQQTADAVASGPETPAHARSAADAHPNYAAIFGLIEEDVSTLDRDWVITSCNERFAKSFGLTPIEVVGKTPFSLNPGFSQSIFIAPVEETFKTRLPAQTLGYSTRTRRWLLVRTFPYEDGLVCFASDATDLDSRHHQLAQLTRRDPLTALENRHSLEEHVSEKIKQGKEFSLIVADLARFTQINDTIGMSAGDRALMEYAVRFKAIAPTGASVYRLGGDQFAIVMPGEPSGVEDVLAALLDESARPVTVEGLAFTLGASVGWVSHPCDGSDPQSLMRRADLARLRAKASGSVRAAVRYKPQLEFEVLNQVKLENALRAAIATHDFSVEYQPKVESRSGRPVGAEALVRWRHPDMGPLSPGEFLPLAEDRGLISAIDRIVVAQVIGDLAQLLRHGIALPIAINLSSQSLGDRSIPGYIAKLLDDRDVPSRLLEIEITESALMDDVNASIEILRELKHLGLRLAIDDFGTGYSSFAYLCQFPVDSLKIDRSFVSTMLDAGSPSNQVIVKGMIAIAHSLRLSVVAEGVETVNQVAALRSMKCDMMQGYFFNRPLKFGAYIKYVTSTLVSAPTLPDPFKT